LLFIFVASATTSGIRFGGCEWQVRMGQGGPGPNTWDERNVWLDSTGGLHLKISHREGQWACAEITTRQRLGFGRYQFEINSRLDQLDDNVVLGLFNYPTADVGSDATHEIDMEFAHWGDARNPVGNYTVWPVEKSLKQTTRAFPVTLASDATTHRFEWGSSRVRFQSLRGWRDDDREEFSHWVFEPKDAARSIAQKPMPVHLNLWLFRGLAPKNGREVEIVVHAFTFVPE